jgi:hypothetical protein
MVPFLIARCTCTCVCLQIDAFFQAYSSPYRPTPYSPLLLATVASHEVRRAQLLAALRKWPKGGISQAEAVRRLYAEAEAEEEQREQEEQAAAAAAPPAAASQEAEEPEEARDAGAAGEAEDPVWEAEEAEETTP